MVGSGAGGPSVGSGQPAKPGSGLGCLATLLLVAAAFAALIIALASGEAVAKCDGEIMEPGDRCVLVSPGDGGTFGYEEMLSRERDAQQTFRTIALVAAPVLVVAGVGVLVVRARRVRRPG
jgi:hypothetical protein